MNVVNRLACQKPNPQLHVRVAQKEKFNERTRIKNKESIAYMNKNIIDCGSCIDIGMEKSTYIPLVHH